MNGNESQYRPGAALSVHQLEVRLGQAEPVRDVSFDVAAGSVHCLLGESGSGKTLTSLAAVGLLPAGATTSGSVRLAGSDTNVLTLDDEAWPSLRGRVVGYVGQNALGCLHPAYSIGFQLVEAIRRHQDASAEEARRLAIAELAAVDLPDPERLMRSVPARLSGGMCQRVAIAIALCNRPPLLIADEPTTALDADTQTTVLELIRKRADADGVGVLLITHDRTVVDAVADATTSIADGVAPSPPASHSPVASTRRGAPSAADAVTCSEAVSRSDAVSPAPAAEPPALEVSEVSKTYAVRRRDRRRARPTLESVTLSVDAGTTVGLVGRSGAGKTTLARIVAGIMPPSAGQVRIAGRAITGKERVRRTERAGLVQYVFQDPFGSLNPRRTAVEQVAEPLRAVGAPADEARDRARSFLLDVGLTTTQVERRPSGLSGGQCQRVGIARALIRRPSVVVLDEPVSALDWSIRDEVLAVLDDLQAQTGAAYVLIAHDRPLIERRCDQIYEVADAAVRPLVATQRSTTRRSM